MASVMLARYDTARNVCIISWPHTANQVIKENAVALGLTKVSDFYSEYSNPNADNNNRLLALAEQVTQNLTNNQADSSSSSAGGKKTQLDAQNQLPARRSDATSAVAKSHVKPL
jgi:hypothetical protein